MIIDYLTSIFSLKNDKEAFYVGDNYDLASAKVHITHYTKSQRIATAVRIFFHPGTYFSQTCHFSED